jgi:hypothetical protein
MVESIFSTWQAAIFARGRLTFYPVTATHFSTLLLPILARGRQSFKHIARTHLSMWQVAILACEWQAAILARDRQLFNYSHLSTLQSLNT